MALNNSVNRKLANASSRRLFRALETNSPDRNEQMGFRHDIKEEMMSDPHRNRHGIREGLAEHGAPLDFTLSTAGANWRS